MRHHNRPLEGENGRRTMISDIERAVASRWDYKDPALKIIGLKKDYFGNFAGFEVFRVDQSWIQNNLDTLYGNGGHGLVHLFIPLNEIWFDDRNYPAWAPIVLHEAVEFFHMLYNDMDYQQAHEKAQRAEEAQRVEIKLLDGLIKKHTMPNIREFVLHCSSYMREPGERTARYFSRIGHGYAVKPS